METHELRFWATKRQAIYAARLWPRAYPVEKVEGWTLYRTQNLDPDDLPPKLTSACVCGDFH